MSEIKFSLDGGKTWQDAPDGIRVIYSNLLMPGEDDNGELLVNFTDEGVVHDVWTTDQHGEDYNIGTSSETVEEIVQRLVDQND